MTATILNWSCTNETGYVSADLAERLQLRTEKEEFDEIGEVAASYFSLHNMMSDGKMEYAERMNDVMLMPHMTMLFTIERKSADRCCLILAVHYDRLPGIGWMIDLMARPLLRMLVKSSLGKVRALSEQRYAENVDRVKNG